VVDSLGSGIRGTVAAGGAVFLSHTSELGSWPAMPRSFVRAAVDAVNAAGLLPVDMGYFPPSDLPPAQLCRERVLSAKVFVGIIGFQYGSSVPGLDISYTELEFDTATQAGLPRLVLMMRDPPDDESLVDIDRRKIDSFRHKLTDPTQGGLTVAWFENPDRLETLLVRGLMELRYGSGGESSSGIGPGGAPAPRSERVSEVRAVGTPVAYGLESFKDRVTERGIMLELLAENGPRLIVVVGPRGIGKSALAAKAIEQALATGDQQAVLLSSRTDGLGLEQLFHDCGQLLDPEAAERLSRLWLSQQSLRGKVAQLFHIFAERRCLVLLDNLEDLQDTDGAISDEGLALFVDYAFRTNHGIRILATSQRPIAVAAAARRLVHQITLSSGIPEHDGAALLRELDSTGEAGLRDAPPELLAKVVRRVHGVPRALELLVGAILDDYLSLPSLDEMLDRFAQRGDVVSNLANSRYAGLALDRRLVVQILAVFRTPVSLTAIGFVLGRLAPAVDAGELVAELARGYMVTVDRQRREYSLHPMDADIAYGDLPEEGPTGRMALEGSVADWFAVQAVPANRWSTVEDVEALRAEFEHRLRASDVDRAAHIHIEITEFLIRHGAIQAALDLYGALADHPIMDRTLWATVRVHAALAMVIGGPASKAPPMVEEALAVLDDVGDMRSRGYARFVLGEAYRRLDRTADAVANLEAARDLAARADSSAASMVFVLVSLGLAYVYADDVPAAFGVCDEMEALAERTSDPYIHASIDDLRSLALIRSGQWSQALDNATKAVDFYERSRVVEPLGYALNEQGLALIGLGHYDLAVSRLVAASTHDAVVNNPRPRAMCLFNLAFAYCRSGDWASAYGAAAGAHAAAVEAESDVAATATLSQAVLAYLNGSRAQAAAHLRETARLCRSNADLAAPDWLMEIAYGLDN
jgi:tetratricopeptide (TPR) repeat protein